MKLIAATFLIALVAFAMPAGANDYSLSTNLVMKGRVPWRVAVMLIENSITGLEERTRAVTSLVKYKSPGLVSHLKIYARDPDAPVRAASFWPLYKNGEREFAKEFLKKEIAGGNTATSAVFFTPNVYGSEYKLELSKDDADFKQLVEAIAKDKKFHPQIRIYAAIHLSQIQRKDVALSVAKEILGGVSPDPNTKEYHDWPDGAQRNWHLRKTAEWCAKLARE